MAQAVQAIGRQTAEGNEHTMTDAKDKIPVQRDRFETWYYEQENHSLRAERMAMSYAEAKAAFDAGWNAAQPAEAQPEPVAQPLHIRALRMADMAIASWENGYAFDAHGPSREAQRLVTEALAAQPAEPVAWLHSKTGRLYDSVEEVPLADGDEWAEPLYLAAPPQPAPAAWRQWSTKQHDWDYSTNRGDLRSDTAAEPLFLAPAQPADEIEHLRADLVSCRGTVKMELSHYERLAMVHGKTVLAANYEAEAQRLSDLLDRIDAMKDTP